MEIYDFNSFDCKHLDARDMKKCHFKGKAYSTGDKVDDLLLSGSCDEACRCEDQKFECEHINCDERFGPQLELGCVRKYSNEKCCSIGTVCGNLKFLYHTNLAVCRVILKLLFY